MGKFRCPNDDYTFSDTVMPMDFAWCLIPQKTVWEDMDTEDKVEAVAMDCQEIWECPECKGLSRFKEDGSLMDYYPIQPALKAERDTL